MSDTDLELAIRLTTEGGKIVVKDLEQINQTTKKTNQTLINTRKGGEAARQGFDRASAGAEKLSRKSSQTSTELEGMIRNAQLMVTGYLSIAGAMNAINRADNFNVLTQRIKTATQDTGDFVDVNRDLYDITQANRSNLESTVEMFQRMATARVELEATNAEMLEFTDAIQELGVIGGTATENIKAGQTQLAQMLSSNVARAEEFNSLLENIPEVANRIAKGLGVSVGQLRLMMLDGQLLSKDVFNAILSQSEDIHRNFAKIELSIASTKVQAGNAINKSLAQLDDVYQVTDLIAATLADMAVMLDDMNVEQLQELVALITAVAGSVTAALVIKKLNLDLYAMGAAGMTASQGLMTKIAAMRTSTVTTNVYGQVIQNTTAKISAQTVATRALAVATKSLLSPIGLAVTAGYLLYEAFSPDEIDQQVTALGQLEQALGRAAKKIDEMTLAEQKATAAEYDKLIQAKTAEITALQQAVESNMQRGIRSGSDSAMFLAESQAQEVLQQQQALENLKNAYSDLQGAIFDAGMEQIKWNVRIKDGKEVSEKKTVVTKKELTANQKLIASLGQQLQLTSLSSKQKLLYSNLSKLSADATTDEIAAVTALTEAMLQQQTLLSDSKYYDDMLNGASTISDTWSSAGNVIIETFGTIGQQIEKLSKQQAKYAEQQKKIAEDKKLYADNPEMLAKVEAAEQSLAQNRTTAHLASYGAIAGAASQMFSKQSKGREALHRLEMGFMAAEMVLSIEKSILNATESITNAGTSGDPYTAPARVLAMAALMAGVLGAAGIGFSSGAGGGNTAADRQSSQGTGTVFGDSDAVSNSVLNSFERAEELELKKYAELQQMNASLNSLNRNITQLAVGLIGSFGTFDEDNYGGQLGTVKTGTGNVWLDDNGLLSSLDPTGIVSGIVGSFSKTKKSLIDSGISIVGQTLGEIIESGLVDAQAYFDIKTKKSSWWGLKSSSKTGTEYENLDTSFGISLALIFKDIANSTNEAIDILGLEIAKETQNFRASIFDLAYGEDKYKNTEFSHLDEYFDAFTNGLTDGATRSLENFKINIPKMSFKDMTGDEIEQALQAMVSQQADLMVQYMVPQIAKYQQVGEGLYETLVRVAQEQAIFNGAVEAMGHQLSRFGDISKEVQTDIAQSIIGLMGGLENFREYTNTYYNEFLTDEEQFTYLENQLSSLFSGLEQTLPTTRDEFKLLLTGIDLTTEAGQSLYASLMGMVGSLDQYYDQLEKNLEQTEKAAKAELELAEARADFTQSFAEQIARMDMTPVQEQLLNLQQEFDDYRAEAEALGADTALLEELYAKKRQAIVDDALANINNTYQRSVDQLVADSDRLKQSFATLGASLSNSILAIRRQGSNWNEVGYQSGQIANFTDLIGQGSIEDQITNISNLEQAYNDKYNAELNKLNAARDAAQAAYDNQVAQINDRYQLELDAYNSIRQVIESLKQAADDLLLSDFSPLTNQQRFDEAQSQFNSILARANAGDADAISQLSNAGGNYLKEAQSFYASSDQFTAIFDRVYDAYNTIGNQQVSAPGKPIAPPVPAAISKHNEAVETLQQSTIEKLLELKELTAELEAQSESEFDLAMVALNEQLANDTALLQAELVSQTSAIQATNNILAQQNAILDVIAAKTNSQPIIKITTPFIHPPKPTENTNDAMLAEMKAMNSANKKQLQLMEQRAIQAEEHSKQSQTELNALKKSIIDGNTTIERQFDELEKLQRHA